MEYHLCVNSSVSWKNKLILNNHTRNGDYHMKVKKIIALLVLSGMIISNKSVQAVETTTVTIEEMVKMLMESLDIKVQDSKSNLKVAIDSGLLKEGEFTNLSQKLTKTDAAVLLERADRIKTNYNEILSNLLLESEYNYGFNYTITNNNKSVIEDISDITYDCTESTSEIYADTIRNMLVSAFPKDNITVDFENYKVENETVFIFEADEKEDSQLVKFYNKALEEKDFRDFVRNHKRISDLEKINKSKQDAVIYCFRRGFFDCKSNGYFNQNCAFQGSTMISLKDAKILVERLNNSDKRVRISPDGQLIRTTNLPKNAADFPYILESFPNSFYEMKFDFMSYNASSE